MPRVKLALISDTVEIDPRGKIFSLVRVFETRTVPNFPVDGRFVVTVFWDGSIDENFDESFTITDSVGIVVAAKPPARVLFKKSLEITFTRFEEVLLQVPDVYTVNIYANGVIAETVRFSVTAESD